jgi:hypothetical protein
MSWADVAESLIDFLKRPTGLGVFCLILFFFFVVYLTPIGVLTWINYDGLNRVVIAISDLKQTLEKHELAFK